ncbi:MAG: hypothetical protein WAM28_02445, partial [Chlamydiales bacterium]
MTAAANPITNTTTPPSQQVPQSGDMGGRPVAPIPANQNATNSTCIVGTIMMVAGVALATVAATAMAIGATFLGGTTVTASVIGGGALLFLLGLFMSMGCFSRAEAPASGGSEQPATRPAEAPASGRSEQPATRPAEAPASGRSEQPA